MKKTLRSRIKEHFSDALLQDIYKICRNSVISDNNIKVDAMLKLLEQYGKDYVELGPGTNRLAVLIDNYVFKIALDKWGMQDNLNEFTMSSELQPYVIKVYEVSGNGLLSVSEYVTVISREEFEEKKEDLREILGVLAESYLLGDVGTVSKNFLNWGYRDNNELVILDFAYIYRVKGEELLCTKCQTVVQYDENFHNLICPSCNKKYTFTDLRRRITMEDEKRENFLAKELAYKVTKPVQEVDEKGEDSPLDRPNAIVKEDNTTMKDYNNNKAFENHQDPNEAYLETLALFSKKGSSETKKCEETERKSDIKITKDLIIPEAYMPENDIKAEEKPTEIVAVVGAEIQTNECGDITGVSLKQEIISVTEATSEEDARRDDKYSLAIRDAELNELAGDATADAETTEYEKVLEEVARTHSSEVASNEDICKALEAEGEKFDPDFPVDHAASNEELCKILEEIDPEVKTTSDVTSIKFPVVENKTSTLRVFTSSSTEGCETENTNDETEVLPENQNEESQSSENETVCTQTIRIGGNSPVEEQTSDLLENTNQESEDVRKLREELSGAADLLEDNLEEVEEDYEKMYDETDRLKLEGKGRGSRNGLRD